MPEQSSPNRNPQSLQSQDILVAGERNRSVGLIIDLGTGTDLNPPACGPTRIPPYEELHVRCGGIYLNYAHQVLRRGIRISVLMLTLGEKKKMRKCQIIIFIYCLCNVLNLGVVLYLLHKEMPIGVY